MNLVFMKQKATILLVYLSLYLLTTPSYGQEDTSFLNPPRIIHFPDFEPRHKLERRKFTGIPSLAITEKEKTFWAVWYAGTSPAEDQNNYVVLSNSSDQGQNWKEVLVIDPDGEGPVRAFDPEVWVDPLGKIWVFWAQTIGMDGTRSGVWSITGIKSAQGIIEWSDPRRLTDGIMMCKPLLLSNGDWVLPASTWRLTDNSARMVVSGDQGQTWKVRGAVHVPKPHRSYDEHHFVEKGEGTLWALLRTSYGIGESYSFDSGKTWSDLKPSSIAHPSARFFIRRLRSGNLLLVKHGPVAIKTGRSHLMAFLSEDNGKSWSEGLLIDQRAGVSYPDGQETADGTVYIIYDRDRTGAREILMTHFKEEDILDKAGDEQMVTVYNRRKIISEKIE
jgi:hypothetical protein